MFKSVIRHRTFSALVAVVVMGLLGLSLRPHARGQTKKTPPEKKPVVDVMVPGVGGLDQVAYINEHIEKMWEKNKFQPSERCDDYTFIRRATLDIVGRIAKIEEIRQYMKDPPNIRRSRLIERLLKSDEYANHFATIWTNLLLTRNSAKMYRDQMRLYLFDEFAKQDTRWDKIVTDLITATGRTNENGAVNFILAHMGEEINGNDKESGRFDMVPVTSRTTKLFLGLQTQCTQCHDHPFYDKWKQHHFWGINAFFRQVNAPQGRPQLAANNNNQMVSQYSLVDNENYNTTGLVEYENRKALVLYTKARFVDGTKMPTNSPKTRRELLAGYITESPYFAKAFVNRMWDHFLGISFTKDGVADFGAHNPVSHPELLEKLAKDWAEKYAHNPRDLIRWICNSRPYGLSTVANKSNATRQAEPFFARMQLKPMTPEQLFESLTLATTPQFYGNTKAKAEKKEEWLDRLVINFGDDEGEEGSFNGTVIQALLLMNGKEINNAISDKDGAVEIALKKYEVLTKTNYRLNHQSVLNYLFLAALNRPPSKNEVKKMLDPKMVVLPGLKIRNAKDLRNFYKDYYEDVMWAMLNSNEFFLNH